MRTPEQVIATLKQYEADHRRTNRLPYADEYRDAIDLIESLQRERNLLAEAIGNAAVKAGICRADADLTGPHLLMLADDMAACILAPLAEREPVAMVEPMVGELMLSDSEITNLATLHSISSEDIHDFARAIEFVAQVRTANKLAAQPLPAPTQQAEPWAAQPMPDDRLKRWGIIDPTNCPGKGKRVVCEKIRTEAEARYIVDCVNAFRLTK